MKEKIVVGFGTLLVSAIGISTIELIVKKRENRKREERIDKLIKETDEQLDKLSDEMRTVTEKRIDGFYNQYKKLTRDQKKTLWKVIG